jgi:hypothetical protein
MSRRDHRTAAAQPWRLLARALVVAGATVAGTSAAWLIGAGLPADAANLHPTSDASTGEAAGTESTVDGAATGRSGPAEFSLTQLDPVRLVRSDSAARLLDAARPVTGALQDSTAEVRHVADNALSTTGAQADTLSTSVDSGLEELGGPLLREETGTQQPGIAPQTLPPPAPGAAPVLPEPPQLTEYEWSAERSESTQRRAPKPVDPPGNPGGSRPFTLPAPPGAPGCGGTADGQQHNNTAVGWYPAEPDGTPVFAGSPTRDTASTLMSAPEPQPGTTPD